MKGIAKIQIFDQNGICEKEMSREENLITNLYKKLSESVYNVSPYHPYFKSSTGAVYNMTPKNLSEGLLLLEDYQEEHVDNFIPKGQKIGWASGEYVGDNTKRGLLNTVESGDVYDDTEIIGYRFVWDFPTHAANGTISCISLCSSAGGNNSSLLYIRGSGGTSEVGFTITDTGTIYKATTTGLIKTTFQSLGYTETNPYKDISIDILGYSDFSRPLYINHYIYVIAKKTTTDKYELLKKDLVTDTVQSSTQLTGITSNVPLFAIAGDYIIYGGNSSGGYIHINVYNYITDTQENDIQLEGTFSWSPSIKSWQTIGLDGHNQAVIGGFGHFYDASFSSNDSNLKCIIVIDENLNAEIELYNGTSSGVTPRGLGSFYPIGNLPIGITQGYKHYNIVDNLGLGIYSKAMFSINNLSSAITKNNTQTMKITYTLLWNGGAP